MTRQVKGFIKKNTWITHKSVSFYEQDLCVIQHPFLVILQERAIVNVLFYMLKFFLLTRPLISNRRTGGEQA